MINPKKLRLTVNILTLILFCSWLIVLCIQPILMAPDSYGYIADSKQLFDPAYHTIRPVLFPFTIFVLGVLHLKLSVAVFLLNSATLYYFLRLATGKSPFASTGGSVILLFFYMLSGIWSYCGTYLTESILFATDLWIFLLLVKIFFPRRKTVPLAVVLYSLVICLLATTLKPWIMIMVLLVSLLFFAASLFIKPFRTRRMPSAILLGVSLLCFIAGLAYNRSKSMEAANIVMLMVSSGNEGRLQDRLQHDQGLSQDSAAFITDVLADINLINQKYKGNAWDASATKELKYLNILDKQYVPSINKAFHMMYFEHFRDVLGLVFLSVDRYISDVTFGIHCLDIAYGPELPVLRTIANPLIMICCFGFLAIQLYRWSRRQHPSPKAAARQRLRDFFQVNGALTVFCSVVLLSAIVFCLLLCLAGANELQRNVLPAALFEVFALTWFILRCQRVGSAQKN